ncbi:MAG TPA: hypothetical protein VMN36_06290 [Verrucomicrobiales bacterium]|nr:hypothetical protein [Verrucomicrobiales bacterium]
MQRLLAIVCVIRSGRPGPAGVFPLWGWNYLYSYDNGGNRLSKTEDAQLATYTPTAENEYIWVGTYSNYTVRGKSPGGSATVTVNGVNQTVDSQSGSDYFRSVVSANNSSGPVWDSVAIASRGDAGNWKHYQPAASVTPGYDPDGNLLSDGRWTYTWDAENRLIKMEKSAAAVAAGDDNIRLEFDYDGRHRRIRKRVYWIRHGIHKRGEVRV